MRPFATFQGAAGWCTDNGSGPVGALVTRPKRVKGAPKLVTLRVLADPTQVDQWGYWMLAIVKGGRAC